MDARALTGRSLGTLSYPAFQGMLASTVPRSDLEGAFQAATGSADLAKAAAAFTQTLGR